MRWVTLLISLLCVLPAANALVISQVLYDPLDSERGGEAVELRSENPIDISGWTLATEASQTDATIPEGTILEGTYLIADSGWSSAKDNPEWKDADLEETITLANANSGVAIKNAAGDIIDAVGWGDASEIKTGLFEGTPAAEVEPGKALVRSKDSDNNIADFSSAEPTFYSGETVEITINISDTTTLPLGATLHDDDLDEPGVQLKPVAGGTRALHLEANYSVTASWFDSSVVFTNNGSVWIGELPLKYWYAPGKQEILISTLTQNITLPVTILEVKAAKLVTKKVMLKASPGRTAEGIIEVKNQGNVPVEISWSRTEFEFGSSPVISSRTIEPTKTEQFEITLDVPQQAAQGQYKTILQMIEE